MGWRADRWTLLLWRDERRCAGYKQVIAVWQGKKGGVLNLDAPLFYKCENQYLISQTVSCEVVRKYPQYIVVEALWTEVMYTAISHPFAEKRKSFDIDNIH